MEHNKKLVVIEATIQQSSLRNSIKCSQCDETFSSGFDYRIHWEKHLDEFLRNKVNIVP